MAPASVMMLDLHNKWLMMSDSFDMQTTAGFMFVMDERILLIVLGILETLSEFPFSFEHF